MVKPHASGLAWQVLLGDAGSFSSVRLRKWPLLSCALRPGGLPAALQLLYLPEATLPPIKIPAHISPSCSSPPLPHSLHSPIVLGSSHLHCVSGIQAAPKYVTSQADCSLHLSAGLRWGRCWDRVPGAAILSWERRVITAHFLL